MFFQQAKHVIQYSRMKILLYDDTAQLQERCYGQWQN